MTSRMSRTSHGWRAALLLAVIPALTNCSRIEGTVELNDGEGQPYSFEGAKVEAYVLDRAVVLGDGSKTRKGLGSVDANGEISLQVITATIESDVLYDVDIRCPAGNNSDACNVESPVHVVLSGAQLIAGGWNANVLTELAFQNIAYYAAVNYSAADLTQVLDNTANALLATTTPAPATHEEILAWNPTLTDTLKRPALVNAISESLAAGIGNNDLKLQARQAVNPYVTTTDLTAQWGESSAGHMAVANGYAYVAGDESGLGVVDISNPEQPVAVGYAPDVFAATALMISGNFAYAAGAAGLQVIDISNPQLPQVTGQLDIEDVIRDLQVAAGHAYVATNTGFYVFDVSTPTAPTQIASVAGEIYKFAIAGTTAYLIDGEYGLQILDISNPAAPAPAGRLGLGSITVALTASADYVYLLSSIEPFSGPGGLQVVDVRNPSAPTLVGSQLDLTPETREVALVGSKLYIATYDSVQLIDVSIPTAPALLAKLDASFSFYGAASLAVTDEFVFVTDGISTLSVMDLSIAAQAVVRSGGLALKDSADGNLSLLGNYAYLANTNMLREEERVDGYDFSNPVAPTPASGMYYVNDFTQPNASGEYAFTLDVFDGALRVINVSDPAAPFVLDDVWLYYFSSDDDVSPEAPVTTDIVLAGNHVYIPWGNYRQSEDEEDNFGCSNADSEGGIGGLFTIDISTPQAPALAGHICVTERAQAIAINGNHAYVAVADGKLQVIDISNPAQPVLNGAADLTVAAHSLVVSGNYVWAAEGGGIDIINVGNPAAPVLVTSIDTPGYADSITFDERYAYVAAGASGILVFDITTPALPTLIGGASTQGSAFSVFRLGNYLQAATGYGFETLRAMPGN